VKEKWVASDEEKSEVNPKSDVITCVLYDNLAKKRVVAVVTPINT
jgi:hypothetical protein